nr:unnamed protein product [Callosobruchus analis]
MDICGQNDRTEKGDILYYWTYVDYFDGKNKLGYTNDDQMFVVDGESAVNSANENPPIDIRQSCTVSVTEVEGQVCAGTLIFEDTFSDFDGRKWTVEQRYADEPDYEFVMYMKRPETFEVKDSKLKIRPVLSDQVFGNDFVHSAVGYDFGDSCTGVKKPVECRRNYRNPFILPPVISAQLSTKTKFSFKYELYLTPASDMYGTKQDCSIRIAFTDGQHMCDLKGGPTVKSTTSSRTFSPKETSSNQDWCDNFHNFGVEWTPEKICMYVNREEYGVVYPPEHGFLSLLGRSKGNYPRMAPFDQKMYITVGVGVGGLVYPDEPNYPWKPWTNGETQSVKKFYGAKDQWLKTWSDKSVLNQGSNLMIFEISTIIKMDILKIRSSICITLLISFLSYSPYSPYSIPYSLEYRFIV